MTKPPGASEQPAVTVVDISDPTDANAGVELLDVDAVQLQSMPMRVRRVVVRLESANVVYHSVSLRVRTHSTVRKGLLGYVAFGPQASGTSDGLPVRPGMMLAVAPEVENTFVTNPGWETTAFLVPSEDILAHLAVRQRESDFQLPKGVDALHVDAGRVRELFDWGKRLVDMALQQPSIFDGQARDRQAA
jgi:hypothetical protein